MNNTNTSIENGVIMRTCRDCNTRLPIDRFCLNKQDFSGHSRTCRSCGTIRSMEWAKNNRDKRNEINRKYLERKRISNPQLLWAILSLKSHKRNGYIIEVTREELYLMVKQLSNCFLCGAKFDWSGKKTKSNSPTLDRIDNQDIITKNNIQIICLKCNTTKGARTMKEFLEYCQSIVKKLGA